MTSHDADAVVVGGGLAGSAAAIAVTKAGLKTIHLAPTAPPDRRTSALMMPSVDFLLEAGLVDDPGTIGHALTQIRIIDATGRLIRAPETLFDAKEAGMEAFGWNFANARLLERFSEVAAGRSQLEIRNATVTDFHPADTGGQLTLSDGTTLSAPLIVGADGKRSMIRAAAGFSARETALSQSALVCDLELGRSVGGTSVEFHYPQGPFTLVPAGGNRANLVWIDDKDVLATAHAKGREHLKSVFLEKSKRLFGTIELVSQAHVFPLSTLTVAHAGGRGVVLVGESAHAFPPIGAQGLNLGLRDVADLAKVLAGADLTETGWALKASEDYSALRAGDLARTGTVVDTIFKSLLAGMLPTQALRAGGLWALKLLPPLRKQAFALGMGRR